MLNIDKFSFVLCFFEMLCIVKTTNSEDKDNITLLLPFVTVTA